MLRAVLMVALLMPVQAAAEGLVATRLIRAMQVIGPDDVARAALTEPGVAQDPAEVVGLEARVAIYPGRPVRLADLGPAAVVERNATVQLVYRQGALMIRTEGRALGRGALGDPLRVMNLASRATVTGIVTFDNMVEVFSN